VGVDPDEHRARGHASAIQRLDLGHRRGAVVVCEAIVSPSHGAIAAARTISRVDLDSGALVDADFREARPDRRAVDAVLGLADPARGEADPRSR
jgi:hypothetical protein